MDVRLACLFVFVRSSWLLFRSDNHACSAYGMCVYCHVCGACTWLMCGKHVPCACIGYVCPVYCTSAMCATFLCMSTMTVMCECYVRTVIMYVSCVLYVCPVLTRLPCFMLFMEGLNAYSLCTFWVYVICSCCVWLWCMHVRYEICMLFECVLCAVCSHWVHIITVSSLCTFSLYVIMCAWSSCLSWSYFPYVRPARLTCLYCTKVRPSCTFLA